MITLLQFDIFKRWLSFWVASFCFVLTTQAQDTSFEITGHRARLQLFPSSNAISCVDTLTIRRISKKAEHFTFRLLSVFDIEYVNIHNRAIEFHRDKDDRDSVILEDIPSGNDVQVVIAYSGELAFHSEMTKMSSERATLRDEQVLPWGNTSLQFVRLAIIVPRAWEAITVGSLISKTSTADSSIFVWELPQPIPMIGWICAGKFLTNTSDSAVQISTHLFEDDWSFSSSLSQLASSALEYFSQRFSPYRFSKLAIVEVEDWVAGRNVLAIACPSFIMVKKPVFTTTDKFNQYQTILPHEVAHQWWPVTVFLDDEADAALLSEGMCEYSARLYDESHNSMTQRDSLNRHPLLRPLIMRVKKGNDIPLHQKANLRSVPTQYLKASYVHNMLRRIVGDSVFFRLYHEYAKRYSLKRAGMNAFKRLAEELSGKKLDWFFDQWVEKKGIPQLKMYNVKTLKQQSTWRTQGRVRIVGYDKFTTFTEVGVQTSSGTTKTVVWLGVDSSGVYRNDAPFEITTDVQPIRATLDPDGNVLKMQKLPAKLSDLRDPSDGIMIVGTQQHADHLLKLARRDSVEMDDAGWSIQIKFDTTVTLADLQQDHVFLYGKASENRIVSNFLEKFPLKFQGDSIRVNVETIFDSTLALIQTIENPFAAQGFVCWIAPLSVHAEPELLPFDASWVLVKGKEEISSGIWEVEDRDLSVEIPR